MDKKFQFKCGLLDRFPSWAYCVWHLAVWVKVFKSTYTNAALMHCNDKQQQNLKTAQETVPLCDGTVLQFPETRALIDAHSGPSQASDYLALWSGSNNDENNDGDKNQHDPNGAPDSQPFGPKSCCPKNEQTNVQRWQFVFLFFFFFFFFAVLANLFFWSETSGLAGNVSADFSRQFLIRL